MSSLIQGSPAYRVGPNWDLKYINDLIFRIGASGDKCTLRLIPESDLGEARHANIRINDGSDNANLDSQLRLPGGGEVSFAPAINFSVLSGMSLSGEGAKTFESGNHTFVGATKEQIRLYRALGSNVIAAKGRIDRIVTTGALIDNALRLDALWLEEAQTLQGVVWYQITQGDYAADNENRVGLYAHDGSGGWSLVASSSDDGNLWKGASATVQSKAFSSAYPAQPGVYLVGCLYNRNTQVTAPVLGSFQNLQASPVSGAMFTNSNFLCGSLTGQNTLPSSFAASSVTQASTANQWIGLYI